MKNYILASLAITLCLSVAWNLLSDGSESTDPMETGAIASDSGRDQSPEERLIEFADEARVGHTPVVENDRLDDAIGLRAVHPDYGTAGSMQELRETLLHHAKTSINSHGTREENLQYWRRMRGCWEVDKERYYEFPAEQLAPHGVPAEKQADLAKLLDSYQQEIDALCDYTFDLVGSCAEDYTFNRETRIPKSDTYTPEGGWKKRHNGPPAYRLYTEVIAGDWKYVIDFNSGDYPALENSLDELAALKKRRLKTVRDHLSS